MNIYSQLNYRNQLGTCNTTIRKSGCFITSLGMIAEIEPPIINNKLRRGIAYANGCMVRSQIAASVLNLDYGGQVYKNPQKLCIGETDHYKDKGCRQHFFILNKDKIIDPLDKNPKWKSNPYHLVSYRLFSKKNTMKNYHIDSKLVKILRKLDKKFDGDKEKDHEKMAEKVKILIEDYHELCTTQDKLSDNYSKSLGLINRLRMEIAGLSRIIKQRNQTIARAKEINEELEKEIEGELLYSLTLGKILLIIRRKKNESDN